MVYLAANIKFKDSEPQSSELPELTLAQRADILEKFFSPLEKKTIVGVKLSYVQCNLCQQPLLEENRLPHYEKNHYGKPTDASNVD